MYATQAQADRCERGVEVLVRTPLLTEFRREPKIKHWVRYDLADGSGSNGCQPAPLNNLPGETLIIRAGGSQRGDEQRGTAGLISAVAARSPTDGRGFITVALLGNEA